MGNDADKIRSRRRTSGNVFPLPSDFGRNVVVRIEKIEVNIKAEDPKRKAMRKDPSHSVAYDSLLDAGYRVWALFERHSMEKDPLYTSLGDDCDIATVEGVDRHGNYISGPRRNKKVLVMIRPKGADDGED